MVGAGLAVFSVTVGAFLLATGFLTLGFLGGALIAAVSVSFWLLVFGAGVTVVDFGFFIVCLLLVVYKIIDPVNCDGVCLKG